MASVPLSEMAFRVLRLEQQLEAYQRLHAQELEEIRRLLEELKVQVLGMNPAKKAEEKPDSDRVISQNQ